MLYFLELNVFFIVLWIYERKRSDHIELISRYIIYRLFKHIKIILYQDMKPIYFLLLILLWSFLNQSSLVSK